LKEKNSRKEIGKNGTWKRSKAGRKKEKSKKKEFRPVGATRRNGVTMRSKTPLQIRKFSI